MSESLVYDIIKREGWLEGHKEGQQESLQQGFWENARTMAVEVARVKYESIPPEVEAQVRSIERHMTPVSQLEQVIRNETLPGFREALERELVD